MRRSHHSQLHRFLVATTIALVAAVTPAATHPGFAQTNPSAESLLEAGNELNSVSGLKALVAKSKAREQMAERALTIARRKKGTNVKALSRTLRNGHKSAWYEARLDYIRQRAYPNDTIDSLAYQTAVSQRQLLAPAVINGAATTTLVKGAVAAAASPAAVGAPVGATLVPRGSAWEFVGPKKLDVPYTTYYGPEGSDTSGRVNGLTFDPNNPNIAYLASAGGGVWKTVDGGANWYPLGDNLTYLQTSAVAVSAKNTQIVLLGLGDYNGFTSGYSQGMMRSTDGGRTWQSVGANLMNGASVSAILFDPDQPDVVIATTGRGALEGSGLFRSTNAGVTWTRIVPTGHARSNIAYWSDVKAGVPDPVTKKRYLYATVEVTNVANGAGVYRSENNGATWKQITLPTSTSYGIRVAPSATDPNGVYFVSAQTNSIYKGVKAAATDTYTWTNITGTDPVDQGSWAGYNWSQDTYDLHLTCAAQVVDGNVADVVYFGAISIAALKGGGASGTAWNNFGRTYSASSTTHNDQHCMAVFPKDPNIMLIGNDGGVYRVDYNSAAPQPWKVRADLSATLGITQFYTGDWSPSNPNMMLGGTQDNATPQVRFSLADWNNVGGGDGCGVGINPTNNLVQYASSQFVNLYRTTDGFAFSGGGSFGPDSYASTATLWSQDRKPFIGQMNVDPTYPHPLYVGTDYLWRWNEDGRSSFVNRWEGRLGNQLLTSGQVETIAIAHSDPNRLYVGTSEGNLWMSSDKCATWR
ncbi:MAG: hypothetical protein H8F28_16780, partial [Fibrella sp.]|nr:hypothetical protein [Armatimonadota bacterium]